MDHSILIATLLDRTIAYDSPDARRIAHLVKVHGYARAIGLLEGLDRTTQLTLEAAAVVHDIGIKVCEQKYGGHSDGKLQEKEGPPIARAILTELAFDPAMVDRVAYLVGHHHTYTDIQGQDYQILIESDFLVNLQEKPTAKEAFTEVYGKIFRTETGRRFFRNMFNSTVEL
ncbi:MAG: HD domain-containing protein [Sphaerochaeta sp.]|nr:HD domain-containing protein [Sphaerochaeta sp.]